MEQQSHKRTFQVRPPTPYAPKRYEEDDPTKPSTATKSNEAVETTESESPTKELSHVKDVPDQQGESTQKFPDADENDFHLQLSPSEEDEESEESSLPDLAGYDKSGKVTKSKLPTCQDTVEPELETSEKKTVQEREMKEVKHRVDIQDPSDKTKEDFDYYSTASEDSPDNEVHVCFKVHSY